MENNETARPYLFDQARRDLGRIWLRPQKETIAPTIKSKEEHRVHLQLSLQLHKQPDNVLMNELAIALQYLPHVDKVEYKDLYAPRRQIEIFMQSIVQAQKLRLLIRKLVARRRLKELREIDHTQIKRMLLEQNHHSLYDWSGGVNQDGRGPHQPNGHHRKKSFTWPVNEREHTVTTKSIYNRFFSINLAVDLPGKSIVSRLIPWRTNTYAGSTDTTNSATSPVVLPSIPTVDRIALDSGLVATGPSEKRSWRAYLSGEETWYMLVLTAMLFELGCFCVFMGEVVLITDSPLGME